MDRRLLYAATFLRSLATGAVGILLGIYLARLNLSKEQISFVIGAGLAGNAVAALVATFAGDRIGRRHLLALLGFLAAAGLGGVASRSDPWLLAGAAFVGMVNGMGRERGAPLVLEQAIVPSLGTITDRTKLFAWYNVLGDVGHGLGAALAMVPPLLRRHAAMNDERSIRSVLFVCALLVLSTLPLSLLLSPKVEHGTEEAPPPLSPGTRRIVAKVSALFSIDALGGGFISTAWLAWFFFDRFHVDETWIGALFFGARIMNALSHLGAAWLARRIGLVNTMVFTHIPSSVLLMTVLIASDFRVAAILFLLREGLSQMDVPTRQSYLMAIVKPEERLRVSGLTHLVRLGSWAVAPFAAGALMKVAAESSPVIVGGTLKIGYDLLLWVSFRRQRPPEESG